MVASKTPKGGKGALKRDRAGTIEESESYKKPRRSERLSQPEKTPISNKHQLPSPVTHQDSASSSDLFKDGTATPPSQRDRTAQSSGKPMQTPKSTVTTQMTQAPGDSQLQGSPTQRTSQELDAESAALTHEVKDEIKEGVWGYLMPLNHTYGNSLVLKKRNACPMPSSLENWGKPRKGKDPLGEEDAYEQTKFNGVASGGYLMGRHPECDLTFDDPAISNRHCLIFAENKASMAVAVIEDLSSNGTYINDALLGRNRRRQLQDGDVIGIGGDETSVGGVKFAFRYPKHRQTSVFLQKYTLLEMLGKGHFAEVFLCQEKSTGERFAVKVFTKQPGDDRKTEGLQQEIAVLMGVSHPNMLCLKDTFDEPNAVFLVLELAAEGELFNWIIMKSKLTEAETRKVFIQLFKGMKYLHERGIVHRDIKPENILLTDKDLHVKIADFGLAKIIGEESFTTTLCGTPSYVAPEILENSDRRRYTRAVDVWSLGVVLYICLCGFPPFSDELYSRENPYTLSQQIKEGRFDYPSPYWDSVGDPALDLIDRMLTVDVEKRYTIDQCLEHPWTTQKMVNFNDSTDGLVGGLAGLDFSKRKIARERTMLSSMNDIKIAKVIDIETDKDPVKVYIKNPEAKQSQNRINASSQESSPSNQNGTKAKQEETPSAKRNPQEFMGIGGKGDQELFGYDSGSIYSKNESDSKESTQTVDIKKSKETGGKPKGTPKGKATKPTKSPKTNGK